MYFVSMAGILRVTQTQEPSWAVLTAIPASIANVAMLSGYTVGMTAKPLRQGKKVKGRKRHVVAAAPSEESVGTEIFYSSVN
jgi:hypothetical protein